MLGLYLDDTYGLLSQNEIFKLSVTVNDRLSWYSKRPKIVSGIAY